MVRRTRARSAATSSIKQRFQRRARLWLQALEDRTVPNTYMVTNAGDTGGGSLRQAISDANTNPGADDIQFDATFFSSPQQIKLNTALPDITDDVVFKGTTAANCTITRNTGAPAFGIFHCNILTVGNV